MGSNLDTHLVLICVSPWACSKNQADLSHCQVTEPPQGPPCTSASGGLLLNLWSIYQQLQLVSISSACTKVWPSHSETPQLGAGLDQAVLSYPASCGSFFSLSQATYTPMQAGVKVWLCFGTFNKFTITVEKNLILLFPMQHSLPRWYLSQRDAFDTFQHGGKPLLLQRRAGGYFCLSWPLC